MNDIIFKTILQKGAKGDKGDTGSAEALPTGSIVGWSGGTIPDGYTSASSPSSWIKKVATTPLDTIAKVIDALTATNSHTNAPSIYAVKSAVDTLQSNINNYWETVYPVGAIYISASSTSPASLFGGTWTQIQEKFLLSAGSTHTAGSTGGAFSKTINVSGTTNEHVLTVEQIPSHKHTIPALSGTASNTGSGHQHTYYLTGFTQSNATQGDAGSVSDEVWTAYKTGNQSGTGADEGAHTHPVTTVANETGNTGGGLGHSHPFSGSGTNDITPPYLAVYMWERTA